VNEVDRRKFAAESRKRQRQERKSRYANHEINTHASSTSTPLLRTAELASTVQSGMTEANKIAALHILLQHGSEEQKAAAVAKLLAITEK
jgi:hypothetical protein